MVVIKDTTDVPLDGGGGRGTSGCQGECWAAKLLFASSHLPTVEAGA